MTKGWTPERRKKQAERCRQNKPWEHSTGPATPAGKAASSRNALKHGERSRAGQEFRKTVERILFYNREFVKHAGEFVIANSALRRLTNEVNAKRLKKQDSHPLGKQNETNEVKE